LVKILAVCCKTQENKSTRDDEKITIEFDTQNNSQ